MNKAELYRKIELIRQSAPKGRFDPYALAQSFGIDIEVYQFDSSRLAGMLLRGEHKSLIILSANRPPEGRRFAASHELVHYFLHKGDRFICTGDDELSAIEWQANEGAAELLMPYKEFIPFYQNKCSLFLCNRARALRLAAEEFGVSAGMIANRIVSLSSEIAQYKSGIPLDKIVPTAARRTAAPTQRSSPYKHSTSCIDIFE